MDIPLIANLETKQDKKRQQLVDENLRRQNVKQIQHQYNMGDRFDIKIWNKTKTTQQ